MDWVHVQYEWVPPRCTKCFNFGHVESQCPTIVHEKWVPKKDVGKDKAKGIEQSGFTDIGKDINLNIDLMGTSLLVADKPNNKGECSNSNNEDILIHDSSAHDILQALIINKGWIWLS